MPACPVYFGADNCRPRERDRHRVSPLDAPLRLALPLICGLFLPVILAAQERPRLAATIGYEFGVPLSIDRTPDLVNRFGVDGRGSAYNHLIRLGVGLDLPDLLAPRLGLAPRLEAGGSIGLFRSSPFVVAGGSAIRRFEVSAMALQTSAELRARWGLDARWALDLGPWISYRVAARFRESELIADPADSTFADGSRDRVVAGGDSLGAAALRFGLVAALSRSFAPADGVMIRPELALRADLREPGLLARALSIGAGVSILWASPDLPATIPPPASIAEPMPRSPEQTPPDTSPSATPDAPSGAPVLRARIGLAALDAAGRRMKPATIVPKVREHRTFAEVPLLVPFDDASAELPARYRPLDRAGTLAFDPSALDRADERTILARALDMIGYRMRHAPELGITLVASDRMSGVEREIEPARVEAIVAYLRDVWEIDAARIHAGLRSGARVPDGCIAMLPGASARPVDTISCLRRERYFLAPRLDIDPEIEAAAGVARWGITVRRDTSVIVRSTSADREPPAPPVLTLDIPENAGPIAPVIAELTVADSSGQVATARDTLELRLDGASVGSRPEAPDAIRRTWVLLRPDGGVGEDRRGWSARLGEIAASVGARERVTVAGDDVDEVAGELGARLRAAGRASVPVAVVRRDVTGSAGRAERAILRAVVTITVDGEAGPSPR